VGVIALGTDATEHELADGARYQHISVLQPLKQMFMPDIRNLRYALRPSSSNEGNAIAAIVVAIRMIATACGTLRYARRITLVTKGTGPNEAKHDELKKIAEKIKADNIELTILSVAFDDRGSRERPHEDVLRKLAEVCEGVYKPVAEAIEQLGIPRMKTTRPATSYRGLLTLEHAGGYGSAICIGVKRYPKVMPSKPPTASKFLVRRDVTPGESSAQSAAPMSGGTVIDVDGSLTAVKQARIYHVDDPEAPSGKREVPIEELAKGYEYGTTAVPISESDMNVVRLESKASLDIIGFVESRKVGSWPGFCGAGLADRTCSTNST
jgi:ATP-dependent DNA helicase 2 subunit 2